MKIAKEIARRALKEYGNIEGDNARFMVIGENDLAALIAINLEPVREALQEAKTLIESAGAEQEEGASQSGPKFWYNQALLIADTLAPFDSNGE